MHPIHLPKPLYPATGRAVRASGPVEVSIKINEEGYVYWAKAISGHIFLRSAAEKAALQGRFPPTHFSGKAVRILGTIVYNFVLD